MTTKQDNLHEIVLSGLDGSNPLAFLAALGTLRTLSAAVPDQPVKMRWTRLEAWRPVVQTSAELTEEAVTSILHDRLSPAADATQFNELGDDLTVSPDTFRRFAEDAARSAKPQDRTAADFAAAFGCDITVADAAAKPTIQDTALRTMAGAGHQHFLGFMRNIISATTKEHLRKALFSSWRYDDPVQNLTLRWDPIDDVRYALRWRNPSGDPSRKNAGSVLGANRLAIEGLPMIVTAPKGSRLITTGFRGRRSTDTFWTWPIWDAPVTLEVVRSLLALQELQADEPDRSRLSQCGIREIFRSQRLTIGKVKNFTPGQSV